MKMEDKEQISSLCFEPASRIFERNLRFIELSTRKKLFESGSRPQIGSRKSLLDEKGLRVAMKKV